MHQEYTSRARSCAPRAMESETHHHIPEEPEYCQGLARSLGRMSQPLSSLLQLHDKFLLQNILTMNDIRTLRTLRKAAEKGLAAERGQGPKDHEVRSDPEIAREHTERSHGLGERARHTNTTDIRGVDPETDFQGISQAPDINQAPGIREPGNVSESRNIPEQELEAGEIGTQ